MKEMYEEKGVKMRGLTLKKETSEKMEQTEKKVKTKMDPRKKKKIRWAVIAGILILLFPKRIKKLKMRKNSQICGIGRLFCILQRILIKTN